jgi:hypothetical protein
MGKIWPAAKYLSAGSDFPLYTVKYSTTWLGATYVAAIFGAAVIHNGQWCSALFKAASQIQFWIFWRIFWKSS